MDMLVLEQIGEEIEKIEKKPGFGQVVITIQDGKIHLIKPTPYILVNTRLDKNP